MKLVKIATSCVASAVGATRSAVRTHSATVVTQFAKNSYCVDNDVVAKLEWNDVLNDRIVKQESPVTQGKRATALLDPKRILT